MIFAELIRQFEFVVQDFHGITISFKGVVDFFTGVIIAAAIAFLLYCLGEKVSFPSPLKKDPLRPFISISLGMIILGTIIAILGVLGILSFISLTVLLLSTALISVPPAKVKLKQGFLLSVKSPERTFFILCGLFVANAFFRLILPETGVDALAYHTEYPRMYLENGSLDVIPLGRYYVAMTPQLAHMIYVITAFVPWLEVSKILHFIFYLCVLFVIFFIGKTVKDTRAGFTAVLFFVTAPVVIRHTSTTYVDFQWLLFWFLLVYVLLRKQKLSTSDLVLGGILFGGFLAVKLQSVVFFPTVVAYIIFIFHKEGWYKTIFSLSIFISAALAVTGIWYIRSFIATGTPFYPQFAREGESIVVTLLQGYFTWDSVSFRLWNIFNLRNASPIFFAIVAAVVFSRTNIFKYVNKRLSVFTIILLGNVLLLPSVLYFGRYLLIPYSLLIFIFAAASSSPGYYKYRLVIVFVAFGMAVYYIFSTIILLPYGLGWSDKNKYLTRVLELDNSTYFDFEHKFSPHLKNDEKVATFRVQGVYYANFNAIDMLEYLYNKEYSVKSLKNGGVGKILIKQGDILWFCKETGIKDCNGESFMLLAKHDQAKMYLYKIL